jgi:hypothetical protein
LLPVPPPKEPTAIDFWQDFISSARLFFLNKTYYADGRTVPPDLLRDPPEQNYLSTPVRVVGFTVMGLALLISAATILWVYVHREHRVVKAAQPYFLYLFVSVPGCPYHGAASIL